MIASAESIEYRKLKTLPACIEGTELLACFAKAHTAEWRGVMARGLADPRPELTGAYGGK